MLGLATAVQTSAGRASAESPPSTVDHAKLEALQRDFATGPEVTEACLGCHTEAAKQVQGSIHWTWSFVHPDTGQRLGKRYVLNSFCSNVRTNEPRCTSCHNGYGWEEPVFDFADERRVDCLSCHDTTGTYQKAPKRAGRVLRRETVVHGKELEPPDLGHVARNVGPTSIETCGSCHFNGGGGDGSKHGDLDSSLLDADFELSVHMSPEGADLSCSDCHVTRGHQMAGGRYDVTARDRIGTGEPGVRRHAATCESCHGIEPHDGGPYVARTLNQHGDRVACATCHIPKIARGGVATKVWWDWSKAGRMTEEGQPIHETNEDGRTTYWSRWGEIRWRKDYRPSYAWFDGDMKYTSPDSRVDPDGIVPINHFEGGPEDPEARIWPFKIMRGRQPYDPEYERLLMTHLFGNDEAAFWRHFEWEPAIRAAMESAKLPYSGEVAFTETMMWWPITHMVAPAEDALDCGDCHARESVLADVGGIYMPGRDAHGALDVIGAIALSLTGVAVLVHASLRVWFRARERRNEG